jgi:hypothetical protein
MLRITERVYKLETQAVRAVAIEVGVFGNREQGAEAGEEP